MVTGPSFDFDAVVLAGGAARRLGGVDKPAVLVGGRPMLDRVVAACAAAGAGRVVVVGPERPVARAARGDVPVVFTREEPPGGGPLAALAAGLRHTERPLLAVLAADLPFLTAEALGRVLDVPPGVDGVVPRDAAGHDQPLTAAYRAVPLRRELAALATARGGQGGLGGVSMRSLLARLTLRRVPAGEAAVADATLDCDTWPDIAVARARIRDDGRVLDEWMAAARAELGLDPDLAVDTTALLDAARDAAHGVARPAAPLTTFLIGYAAAHHGLDPAEAARRIEALAESWAQEQQRQDRKRGDASASGSGSRSVSQPASGSADQAKPPQPQPQPHPEPGPGPAT